MAEFKICSKDEVNYVEIILKNESVRTESGAMRYMQGSLEMESQAPSVGGFFKSMMSGETAFKPTYKGTGKLVLEHSFKNFHLLELKPGESYILDQGAYYASDITVEVSAYRNAAFSAFFSGEGWFQTIVKGPGKVIFCSPGPVELVELMNDRLVVDGNFAVARSESLKFEVAKATKSLLGSLTSGEGLVNTFTGTGRVYLSPVPNRLTALGWLVSSMIPRGK